MREALIIQPIQQIKRWFGPLFFILAPSFFGKQSNANFINPAFPLTPGVQRKACPAWLEMSDAGPVST